MMKLKSLLTMTALISSVSCFSVAAEDKKADQAQQQPLTIFVAKEIVTMEPAMPTAKAVAVADGRIVAVGTLDSLKSWIDQRGATIDKTFEDFILMPGLIDPHVHPSLPAVTMQFPYIAPDDWSLPTGEFPGAKTPEAYKKRLTELVNAYYADPEHDAKIPFITWGYHELWHGPVYRDELNAMFPDKAVMLWQRSFHELIGNDKAFELLNVKVSDVKGSKEIDWAKGHFWENGLMLMLPKMPFLLRQDRYEKGMKNFADMMHQNGVTSVMDMGVGIFGDPVGETKLIRKVMEENSMPSRIILTPIITDFLARGKSIDEAKKEIAEWTAQNTRRVQYDNHFKIMMDGAIYSGASQTGFPGYIDGHKGMWMAPLETTYEWAEAFWMDGFQIHAHVNGDKSTGEWLNMLRKLLDKKPRFDHRFSLEHFAYTTEDQNKQIAALNAVVSANPYYQYILSDIYSEKWLGDDRGRQMVRLGSLEKKGIPFGLHSDCPMAPLSPLTLAWTAVNRTTINGNKNNQQERISVDAAMKAITIDAAWIMRKENDIGSIRAGKLADFTVLNKNPYRVNPKKIKDIKVIGTVFEGEYHPVN